MDKIIIAIIIFALCILGNLLFLRIWILERKLEDKNSNQPKNCPLCGRKNKQMR